MLSQFRRSNVWEEDKKKTRRRQEEDKKQTWRERRILVNVHGHCCFTSPLIEGNTSSHLGEEWSLTRSVKTSCNSCNSCNSQSFYHTRFFRLISSCKKFCRNTQCFNLLMICFIVVPLLVDQICVSNLAIPHKPGQVLLFSFAGFLLWINIQQIGRSRDFIQQIFDRNWTWCWCW